MESSVVRQQVPTPERVRAAATLLLDPSPRVHEACADQLLRWGAVARAPLESLCEAGDAESNARVRAVLRRLNVRCWVASFRDFVGGQPIDLETGLLHVARLPRPLLDLRRVVAQLDEWADALRPRVEGLGTRRVVSALAQFFRDDLGFRGDNRRYYDPGNNFLDQVLRRRRGVPISLCAVYVLVGRRVGLPIEGVGLPGHFILRMRGARSVLLDPFHGGRVLTRRDCIERIQAMGYSFHESLLEGVTDARMLIRSLGNLLHTLGCCEDEELVTALQEARQAIADSTTD